MDEKFYDLHFDANVKGLFFTIQKALPLLKDGAAIILNASIATIKGFPGISVYSGTKAAVRSFARTGPMNSSERVKTMLREWCKDQKEGWVFPSDRSKSGHLTTIATGFRSARERAGVDKKVVPYSARHTCRMYMMERSRNAFAVEKSMGTLT